MKRSAQQTEITKEEYICYLYLSIADADMHISDIEIEALKTGLRRILTRHYPPLRVDIEQMIYAQQHAIRLQTDDQKKEIIFALSKKHPLSIDMKLDILSDIHDLIQADDFIALSEYNMLNYIRLCLMNDSLLENTI
jgi:hypothetical protein